MNKLLITALFLACTAPAFAQNKGKAPVKKAPVKSTTTVKTAASVKLTALDSACYGFGMAMASSLQNAGLTTLNYDLLTKGIKDAFNGGKPMLNEMEAQMAIQKLIKEVNTKKFAPLLEEGKAFLDKNKTQPGIQTTASGIQYLVLTQGTGEKPSATDTVTVNYKGSLISGEVFDASELHGGPATFPLNRVIQGWTEGLQLMKVGSKYRLFIPYNLAYGERGSGEKIPPFSTLIFEIELLSISKSE